MQVTDVGETGEQVGPKPEFESVFPDLSDFRAEQSAMEATLADLREEERY